MARPVCCHCGKPYGSRHTITHTVKYPLGAEPPPYTGNAILVKESKPYQTVNRETVRAVTMLSVNPEIRKQQEQQIASQPEKSENVITRTTWDGDSWLGGYSPFCTLRCALAYARIAYTKTQTARNVR